MKRIFWETEKSQNISKNELPFGRLFFPFLGDSFYQVETLCSSFLWCKAARIKVFIDVSEFYQNRLSMFSKTLSDLTGSAVKFC